MLLDCDAYSRGGEYSEEGCVCIETEGGRMEMRGMIQILNERTERVGTFVDVDVCQAATDTAHRFLCRREEKNKNIGGTQEVHSKEMYG